jgi:AraC family transcriptional regulator
VSKSQTKSIYFERINKVLVYIDSNLGEKMDLGMLADLAHFSPFHFHKIMRAYLREFQTKDQGNQTHPGDLHSFHRELQ